MRIRTGVSIYVAMRCLLIVLTLTIPLAFSGCLEDDELPPITMTGKNTFGCFVNGKLWLPKGSFNVPGTFAFHNGGSLTISAVNHDSGFSFIIQDPIKVNQVYDLTDSTTIAAYYDERIGESFCVYEEYQVKSGTLKISRFDSVVSGVFEFTTFNPSCHGTIKVTDGRFDMDGY